MCLCFPRYVVSCFLFLHLSTHLILSHRYYIFDEGYFSFPSVFKAGISRWELYITLQVVHVIIHKINVV